MVTFCPNIHNKQVLDEFNQIIQALGGRAMTEEEFRSADLRAQRSGLDYSAMNMAYVMHDLNRGNSITQAPNGEQSILFSQLLDYFGGNINKAIVAKSRIYRKSFLKNIDNIQKDKNGEPIISEVVKVNSHATAFNRFFPETSIGTIVEDLNAGHAVSSSNIISALFKNRLFSASNIKLSHILKNHDIPVRFDNLPGLEVAKAIEIEGGGTVIVIDRKNASKVSNRFLADTMLHEVIHALTVQAINNPNTEIEKAFARSNRELFKLFDKAFPQSTFSRNDVDGGFYILNNEKEFASVYLTDRDARLVLLQKAIELDARKKGVFTKIKRFINAFTKLLVNKNVFKTTQDKLKRYEDIAYSYLVSRDPVKFGGITKESVLKAVYEQIDPELLANEQLVMQSRLIERGIKMLESNNMLNINPIRPNSTVRSNERIRQKFNDIADDLTSRLLSVKVSELPKDYKVRQQQILESQIQQFKSNEMTSFAVISNFLSQIRPQLRDDLRAIQNVLDSGANISPTIYMYQRHDNFGTYSKILTDLSDMFKEDGVRGILIRSLAESQGFDDKRSIEYINKMKSDILDCKSIAEEGEGYAKSIKTRIVSNTLAKIGQQTHSPTMAKYLEDLEKIGYDTSAWFLYAGSVDRAKDDGLRSLAFMVNKAINTADRKSNTLSIKLLTLLDKLKSGEGVEDLYELDADGKTTGYLVRKYNYGKFFKDYNDFLANLNLGKAGYKDEKGVTHYIKTALDVKNRIAPDDESDRVIWNLAKIQWLSERCDRRYLPKYYQAYAKLSQITAEKRELIQSNIRALKSSVYRDGVYHFEDMNPDDYKKYQSYIQERRILQSDYDINGHKKDVNSIEWKVAKELQQLNEDLYGDKNAELKYDEEKWRTDRANYIQQQVEKGVSEQEAAKLFDQRCSKRKLKIENGKVALFEHIDNEFFKRTGIHRDEIKYDTTGQLDRNKEEIKSLLAPYRNSNTGEYNSDMVPVVIQERVKELEQQNSAIKRKASDNNPMIKAYNKIYQEIFEMYAESVPTEAYNRMKQEYDAIKQQQFSVDLDTDSLFIDDLDDSFDLFAQQTEYITGWYEDGTPITQRYRWYNSVKPKPEYESMFVEFTPGDGYIINEDIDSLLNPDFDESQNMSMVPKLSYDHGRYDNSKQYNKIMNSDTLRALYEAIHEAIAESNALFTNKEWHDDYLLPQITGSFYKRLKRQESKANASWEYVKDTFGIMEQQNTEFGMSLNNALNNVDDLGEIIMSHTYSQGDAVSSRRPNGRQLNMIPQYYTRKLEDPSQISADIIGITCEYYRQAYRYSEKSKIKDACEAIVDMMEDREYSKKNRKMQRTTVKGDEANTTKVARKFLDMNLYNIRSQRYEYNIFGKDINLGKAAALFRNMTVAINLGLNIAVAGTGFFTAAYSHLINGLTGSRYGFKEVNQAGVEVMWHMLENGMGARYIGDKLTKDKVMLIMELYNVADQGIKKYEHSNRNRAVNIVWDNWCFGMLTSQDFLIKANIAVSTLMAYRYYDGHFITREDLANNMYNATPEEYTKALAEWEDGRSVYSVMSVDGHSIKIEDEFQNAYDEINDVLHNRIIKYSEAADGMATETQKAAITTNFLGAAVLTHRQYLPLMLTERFGEMTWDMDTQQYTGGIFRTGAHYLFNILGMFFYDLIRTRSLLESQNRYKSNYDRYFNDMSSIENAALSNARRRQLRQIMAEQLVFWTMVTPIAGILAMLADDDDNKDKLMLQMAAYIARRTQWETYTPYRFDDILNNIKTVSAQTGTLDKFESLGRQAFKYVTPTGSLYDTFFKPELRQKTNSDTIKRGVYKDWTKLEKSMFQTLPIHNVYEQIYGSKDKRKYYENQIMNK